MALQNIADLEAGRPDPARLVEAAEAIAPRSRQLSQHRQRLAAEGLSQTSESARPLRRL
jgi:hypothetical protein